MFAGTWGQVLREALILGVYHDPAKSRRNFDLRLERKPERGKNRVVSPTNFTVTGIKMMIGFIARTPVLSAEKGSVLKVKPHSNPVA